MTDYEILGSSLVLVCCLAKRKRTINRRVQIRSDMEQFNHFGTVFVKEDCETGKWYRSRVCLCDSRSVQLCRVLVGLTKLSTLKATNLDDDTTAANHFACFAVFVNFAKSCPLTKLLVVFNLTSQTLWQWYYSFKYCTAKLNCLQYSGTIGQEEHSFYKKMRAEVLARLYVWRVWSGQCHWYPKTLHHLLPHIVNLTCNLVMLKIPIYQPLFQDILVKPVPGARFSKLLKIFLSSS